MKQRTQRLIDEEADQYVQKPFAEREGHVEDQKAIEKRIAGRNVRDAAHDRLIRGDDRFLREMQDCHIRRIDDEVVQRQADQRHRKRADDGAQKRGAARLFSMIKETRHHDEHAAEHEVARFPDACGRAERQVNQVFHELNEQPPPRTERVRTEQRGKVR